VAREPVPQRLLEFKRPARLRAAQVAAAVATLAIGAGAGSLATLQLASEGQALVATAMPQRERGTDLPRFVHQASVAHAVFTPEARRPVEVGADQEPALDAWLSKRLGRRLKAPSRLPQGFTLMGGRLLPGEPDKPAAQFMYENTQGQRLTVYLRGMAQPTPETAFRYGERKGVGTFYWVDGDWGYALSGELPRAELLQIAKAVYEGVTAGQ
jgi:anti-sigma factor RsiW